MWVSTYFGVMHRRGGAVFMLRIGACNDATGQLGEVASACRRWTDNSSFSIEFRRFHSIDELLFEREIHGHFDIVFIGSNSDTELVAESAVRLIREDRYTAVVLMLQKAQLPGMLPVIHSFFFLYKPICRNDVGDFLDTYTQFFPPKKFIYRRGTFFHAVWDPEIICFIHDKRVVTMYKADGTKDEFYMKLDEVEKTLCGSAAPFLRIHESYLINLFRIRSMGRDHAIMENGMHLAISVKYRRKSMSMVKERLCIR